MIEDRRALERETIVAPATPPGRSALAIIRVSGPAVRDVIAAVFKPLQTGEIAGRRPTLGRFVSQDGEPIDEGMVTLFPAPRSYSGEDLAEFTVHGAPPVLAELLEACCRAGARPAEPGEFTLRALRNGKLDLAQAEAVADLVAAGTIEQARVAVRQIGGEVGDIFTPMSVAVVDLLADLEAGLDFAEEEAELATSAETLAARCEDIASRLDILLASSEAARRVREGARVALSGPPNAGKSSLFNRLVGFQRVIVTDEPGTTRDIVEETVSIEGLPVVLVDGAGLGEARGRAEEEGMERARRAAAGAQLVLEVYDLTGWHRPAPPDGNRLPVGTRADLSGDWEPSDGTVIVSCTTGEGIAKLKREIAARLHAPGAGSLESVALATARHREAARGAIARLLAASSSLRSGAPPELAAVELREAVTCLRSILGAVGPEEILGRIFSRFCIGK
jgi:tRNA modification GTPase